MSMQQLSELTFGINVNVGISSKKFIFIVERDNGYITLLQFAGMQHNLQTLLDNIKTSHNGTLTAIKVIVNDQPSEWHNVNIRCELVAEFH